MKNKKYVDNDYEYEPDINCVRLKENPNYWITENGNIWSDRNNKWLRLCKCRKYIGAKLPVIQTKTKMLSIHRLVAKYFLPLPRNYNNLEVNHKDFDKHNNNANNLEWCSKEENYLHAVKGNKIIPFKIQKCDLNHNVVETFNSIRQASKLNDEVAYSTITRHLRHKNETTYKGFIWKKCD